MKELRKVIFTDLDGTLLGNDGVIDQSDLDTLHALKKQNCIRVAATGRSLYSSQKVISESSPFDYLVFSSGAGIIDCKSGKLIQSFQLVKEQVDRVFSVIKQFNVDFAIHHPIPENHFFTCFSNTTKTNDFKRRLDHYKNFAIFSDSYPHQTATQFLIVKENGLGLYQTLCQSFADLSIIRNFSPLDGQTLWIEIFPGGVSKGRAAKWLCKQLSIDNSLSMSIGNDFNDLDMLEWTKYSYVVDNAPIDLKSLFNKVASHDKGGFSEAVKHWLKELAK